MKLNELIVEAAPGVDFKVVLRDKTDNIYVTQVFNLKGYAYIVPKSQHYTKLTVDVEQALHNNEPVYVVERRGFFVVALPAQNRYVSHTLGEVQYNDLVDDIPQVADIIKPISKPQQATSNPLLSARIWNTIGEKVYQIPTVSYMTGDFILYFRQLAGQSLDPQIESFLRVECQNDNVIYLISSHQNYWIYSPAVDRNNVMGLNGGKVRSVDSVISKPGLAYIQSHF